MIRVNDFQEACVLTYLFLEQPWPLVIALLLVTVALTTVGRRQQRPIWRDVGWSMVAVAAVVLVVARQVETDREQLMRQTRELVQAAQSPMDVQSVDRLLADDVVLVGPDRGLWLEREGILAKLRQIDRKRVVEGQSVGALNATVTDSGEGLSRLSLHTQLGGPYHQPAIGTQWVLHWRQADDGHWRLHEIEWLRFFGQKADQGMLHF